MNAELKQFLYDQKRFQRGLPPEPMPFSRHPRPPALDSPDAVPAKVEAPRVVTMTPSKLRRLNAHLAKFGQTYTGPPPTLEQLRQRQPQYCRECNNGWAGRVLLPPDEGRFFKDHRGPRWICHRCIAKHNGESDTSVGENRLHELLHENGVPHQMRADIEGVEFDCYIAKWNLIVEVDSWSAHHTAAQKKKDYHRNKLAQRLHIHLLRVKWDDRDMLVKVLRARQRGLALRRQAKLVQPRKPPRIPCTAWATSV